MKTLALLSLLAAVAFADEAPADEALLACPTITKEALPSACARRCSNENCIFVSQVANPCSCPSQVPVRTLLYSCEDNYCPYDGCQVEFRTPRPQGGCTTTTTTTRRTTTTTTTTRTTTSPTKISSGGVTWGVTTLPPRPTTTTKPPPAPCPTVFSTLMPGNCEPLRCPVPDCLKNERLSIPCGCAGPKTVLQVQGCSSVCPDCMTRTQTISAQNC